MRTETASGRCCAGMAKAEGIVHATAAYALAPRAPELRRRWHLATAAGMVLLCAVIRLPTQDGDSWFYFDRAARSFFGHDGFHVFARHPELQFGPAAIAATELVRIVGRSHTVLLVEVVLALL